MTRADAVARSLAALRFFRDSDQSGSPEATGYNGFYYHFLDLRTGDPRLALGAVDDRHGAAHRRRADGEHVLRRANTADESELRELVDALYRRIDWRWAQDGKATIRQGWKPECGFLALRVGRLQRGDRAVRARPGLADSPARGRLLPRVDRHLPVGEPVRLRLPVRGAALRSTSSRTRGSIFAASGIASCARSAPTTSRTAGARPTSSASTRGATRANSPGTTRTAGASRPVTARATSLPDVASERASSVRLRRAGGAVRTG